MFPTSIWIEGLVSPPPSFCQLKQKHNIFKSVFLLSFHCLESSYRWVLMIMCIQFGWKGSYHALLTLILIKPGASAYVYLSLVWKNLTVLRALTLWAKHSSPFAACFQSAGGFGQPVYLQRASVARWRQCPEYVVQPACRPLSLVLLLLLVHYNTVRVEVKPSVKNNKRYHCTLSLSFKYFTFWSLMISAADELPPTKTNQHSTCAQTSDALFWRIACEHIWRRWKPLCRLGISKYPHKQIQLWYHKTLITPDTRGPQAFPWGSTP